VDVATTVQFVTAASKIIFAGVVGIGYYLLIRVSREPLDEMREARVAGAGPRSSSRQTTPACPWSTS